MKTITQEQYYQLAGLGKLADDLYKQLDIVEKSAYSITGEKEELGYTTDYIGGNRTLDELLEILKIKVENNENK